MVVVMQTVISVHNRTYAGKKVHTYTIKHMHVLLYTYLDLLTLIQFLN